MQNKLHYVIAEFVPVTFIENSSFMHAKIEEDSALSANTLVFSKYIKPSHLCSINQKVAHVTLGFKDRHAANAAIQSGLFVEGKHVSIRKKLIEPRRCLKCQKFGHFVPDCKADVDTCAHCNGSHRTSDCNATSTAMFCCSNCIGNCAKGHGSADRNCPAFKAETEKLLNCIPDNRYRFFPTAAPGTWKLTNEPDTFTMQDPQRHNSTAQHNHTGIPPSQQNLEEGWQSTCRGKPNTTLSYQDRHYVPRPRTDTYIPDNGWPPKHTQSTLDKYINTNMQPAQGPTGSNPPPPTSQAVSEARANHHPQEAAQQQTSPPASSQTSTNSLYA